MLVAADETTEELKEREEKEVAFERRESVLSTSSVSINNLFVFYHICNDCLLNCTECKI